MIRDSDGGVIEWPTEPIVIKVITACRNQRRDSARGCNNESARDQIRGEPLRVSDNGNNDKGPANLGDPRERSICGQRESSRKWIQLRLRYSIWSFTAGKLEYK